jgi:hypothetical protein
VAANGAVRSGMPRGKPHSSLRSPHHLLIDIDRFDILYWFELLVGWRRRTLLSRKAPTKTMETILAMLAQRKSLEGGGRQ